jgi:hypothetical protein
MEKNKEVRGESGKYTVRVRIEGGMVTNASQVHFDLRKALCKYPPAVPKEF